MVSLTTYGRKVHLGLKPLGEFCRGDPLLWKLEVSLNRHRLWEDINPMGSLEY